MSAPGRLQEILLTTLQQIGWVESAASHTYLAIALGSIVILAALMFYVANSLLRSTVANMVARSKSHWDDELYQHGFFFHLAHMVPAVVIQLLTPQLLEPGLFISAFVSKAALVYLIVAGLLTINALLNTVGDLYNQSELARRAPITGFIQVVKLVLAIVALLIVIANLLDRSPIILLSGLGAVTAVLMLVFKDAILGFVAGIQIAANRMVTNGDWIEMAKYGADGTVLEVGLTTVKVQNWDNTITTIPTYALISESFKNWRGMQESSGRRIKRSLLINLQSVRFCDDEQLQRFKQIRYISQYVENKVSELARYHQDNQITEQDLLNARRLTNLGTFRAYMEQYLRHHKAIHQEMTLMVRQLAPSEKGLPLEIYCFSSDKNWVNYEKIQADLFDHFIAMLPVFDLLPYQAISDQVSIDRTV